jgi:eukaryotic-like serine/threonine-protein kinase
MHDGHAGAGTPRDINDNRFSRTEQIYHQALERSEEERPAFLTQACGGDDSLRREVEKLLSFDKKAGSFMESPALDLAAQAMAKKAGPGKKIDFVGQTILHYRVMEKIGEGGMGIVYKALDTHLNRPIAIKVLPPEIVADRERRARFVQEARAASALNHPNIVHVYDIDQSDGTDFIAMEYVAGTTLGELIPRKGMRLNDVLKYSVQIADALAAAHAAGIVHRDLKPANVMVTEKGLVKVLDFGLAKLTESAEKDESGTTETLEPRTEEGTILGTAAYMSPEQAEGKKVDARSDIFSLGSVLYEMVTGQKAFQGTSKMSTLSAILHQEPKPVSGITPAIPADLEKLITRCLRKDPAKRFQHMDDVKVALDELKEDSDSGKLAAGAPAQMKGRSYLWLSMIVVLVAVLAVAAWFWLGRSRPAAEEGTLTPVPLTTYPGAETYPSFSPDGTQVTYQGCPEGWAPGQNCDIYVKQIGMEPPSRLTDTPEQEYGPAWSPDGRFIAFLRQLSTEKVSLILIPQRGGRERVVAELDVSGAGTLLDGPYLAWTPDSKWVVTPVPEAGSGIWSLYLFSVETGEKRKLTNPPAAVGEGGDTAPAFSPNGRILAFARIHAPVSDVWLLSLGEGYAPSGEPERVPSETPYSIGAAWTADGSEIVFSSGRRVATRLSINHGLWQVAAAEPTKPRRLTFAQDDARAPAISRLGNRLAYAVERRDSNIWRVDLQGPDRKPGVPFKLISSTRSEGAPAISPDGKRIAFGSDRSGGGEIWLCDSDGSNPVQLTSVAASARDLGGMKWSPDGKSIVFDMNVGGEFGVYVINMTGGVPPRLPTDPARCGWPCWSRDGQWIYFRSARNGTNEIWKMPVTGGDAIQITRDPDGADLPHESPDGKFVYYSKGWPNSQSVWRVAVEGGEATKVLDGVHRNGSWTVGADGIYFFTEPDDKGQSDLAVHEFAMGKIRKILTIERPVGLLDVSRNGRTILYDQVDEAGSDLMLVENFR